MRSPILDALKSNQLLQRNRVPCRATPSILLTAVAWLSMTGFLVGQEFRVDSLKYDNFSGLAQLRWQNKPGGVYGVFTSTNLITWEEMKSGREPMRFFASSGIRTEVELVSPQGRQTFWRVQKRPITDLGTLIAEDSSAPILRGVNDYSRVVGYFQNHGNSAQTGFTWAPDEELVSFGPSSYAVAVNNGGMVVGTRYGFGRFFSWTKIGGLVELGTGVAIDVNEAGHIVGRDDTGAFLWKPGVGKIRIPHLSATGGYTVPASFSDAGHVVGDSLVNGSYYRAFLWTESGGMVDLTGALSSAASGASKVNGNGQVVGHRTAGGGTRAFSWTAAGGFVTFPAGCYITDLTENGTVVGRGYNGTKAFSWTQAGGIMDLGEWSVEKVNEAGQMVGYTMRGATAAILWSANGGQTELEGLSSLGTVANLIDKNGVVFGYSKPVNSSSSHLIMWTPKSNP